MAVRNKKVLVLNKNWVAIRVVTCQQAIALVFSTYKCGTAKAKIVETEGTEKFQTFTWSEWEAKTPTENDDVIRTTKKAVRIPEIILLSRYNKVPNQKPTFSRSAIYARDNGRCQYCNAKTGPKFTLEHVVPKSKNGRKNWENIVVSCEKCNFKKADMSLEQANMKLLSKPVAPSFNALFMHLKDHPLDSWKDFI